MRAEVQLASRGYQISRRDNKESLARKSRQIIDLPDSAFGA